MRLSPTLSMMLLLPVRIGCLPAGGGCCCCCSPAVDLVRDFLPSASLITPASTPAGVPAIPGATRRGSCAPSSPWARRGSGRGSGSRPTRWSRR